MCNRVSPRVAPVVLYITAPAARGEKSLSLGFRLSQGKYIKIEQYMYQAFQNWVQTITRIIKLIQVIFSYLILHNEYILYVNMYSSLMYVCPCIVV